MGSRWSNRWDRMVGTREKVSSLVNRQAALIPRLPRSTGHPRKQRSVCPRASSINSDAAPREADLRPTAKSSLARTLVPMTFVEPKTATLRLPPRRHPLGIRKRRHFPTARLPLILVVGPSPVTRNPSVGRRGLCRDQLGTRSGGSLSYRHRTNRLRPRCHRCAFRSRLSGLRRLRSCYHRR